jgi:electron transfer flavoprotein alpha/beta subunit
VKVIVCIKQVPDTTNVKINPETNTLIREGVESIINPFDMYAIEEGIRIKEKYGGEVIALSMGPPQVESSLKEAISLGVDQAYLLSDRAFAGADTLATAYTLAAGIKALDGADIILMGKQAIDGDTGQVGPGVAENLSLPHITDVRKIEEIDESGYIIVERLLEDGYLRLKTKLPVILTVVKEINEPRLPSLKGKMRAKKEEITVWTKDDLDIDAERIGLTGSPTQVIKIFTPPKPGGGKIFQGDTKEMVKQLIDELNEAGIHLGRKKENVK